LAGLTVEILLAMSHLRIDVCTILVESLSARAGFVPSLIRSLQFWLSLVSIEGRIDLDVVGVYSFSKSSTSSSKSFVPVGIV
jgi:hypothetical protein